MVEPATATDVWLLDKNKKSTQKVKMKAPDSPMDQGSHSTVQGMMEGIKFVQGRGRDNTIMKPGGFSTIMGGSVLVKTKDPPQQRPVNPSSFNIKMKEDCGQTAQLQTVINIKPKGTTTGKRKFDGHETQVSSNDALKMKKALMDLYTEYNEGKTDLDKVVCLETKETDEGEMKEGDSFKIEPDSTIVGKGSFGTVYSKKLKNGKSIVIKQMTRNPESKAEVNEVMASLDLRKPGIVKIFGLKCLGDRLWIMMEDAGRSLKWWLTNTQNNAFRCWHRMPGNLKKFSINLFNILKLLEIQAIVHRDIKPENLCLAWRNGEFVVTLVDFGSAQSSQDKVGLAGHSTEYLPPACTRVIYLARTKQKYELHQNLFFEEKCDAWAVGIVILTVFNGGYHPIRAVNEYSPVELLQNQQRLKVMEQIIQLTDGCFEPLLKGMEESLQYVLRRILRINKEERWTARQAGHHLEGDRWMALQTGTHLGGDGQGPVFKMQKMSVDVVGQFLEKNCQAQGNPLFKPSNLAPPLPHTVVGVMNPATNPMRGQDDQTCGRRDEGQGGLSAMGVRTKVIGMPVHNERPTSTTTPCSNECGPVGPKIVGIGGPMSKLNASHLIGGHWTMNGGGRRSGVGGSGSNNSTPTPPLTPMATGMMNVGGRCLGFGGFVSRSNNGTPTPTPMMNQGENIPNILFDEDDRMETTRSAVAATAASQKASALGIRRMFGAQPESNEDIGTPGFGEANQGQMQTQLEGGYSVPNLDMMLDMGVTTISSGYLKRQRQIQTGRRRSSKDKPSMHY